MVKLLNFFNNRIGPMGLLFYVRVPFGGYSIIRTPPVIEGVEFSVPSQEHCGVDMSAVGRKVITFVTGNQNKLREITQILGSDCPVEIIVKDADLPEYQGDSDTVSIKKCKTAYEVIKAPVLVEDTSLCFDAMKGLPGPYIKWFLKSIGPNGLHKMLQGFDDHSASAIATLAYYDGTSDEVILFKGITRGKIVAPKGTEGFGWDSCFNPDGYSITYAEMVPEEKNSISHRKKAVEKMRDHFMTKK